MSYCDNCGKLLDGTVKFCPNCGAENRNTASGNFLEGLHDAPERKTEKVVMVREKSEGVGAVLSFFLPGLGQMYAGKIMRGIGVMLVFFVIMPFLAGPALAALSLIGTDPSADVGYLFGLSFFLAVIIVILIMAYSIIDAYESCREYNTYLEDNGCRKW